MRHARRSFIAVLVGIAATFATVERTAASGMVGLFGIIERVVLEPNDTAPARAQVFGAFAYSDYSYSVSGGAGAVSPVRRGFLYFRVPDDQKLVPLVRREWNDLKAVAGTGEAVGFGTWGYTGVFGGLDPAGTSGRVPYILEMYPGRGVQADMRVRPSTEKPGTPVVYQMEVGVTKIPATGSRAELVRQLRAAVASK